MEQITLTYSDFVALLSTKLYLRVQYVRNDIEGVVSYYVFALDASVKYETAANSQSEIAHFETYLKPTANRQIEELTSDGIPVMSPSLDDTLGLYPKKKMYRYDIVAGETNIFDELVTFEKRINGGEYWIKQADVAKVHEDDYVEFSIVDKNDVLGLFSTYGIPPGGVLELCKFVNTEYVLKGSSDNGYHTDLSKAIKGTNRVFAGLFMRTYYFSYGTENLQLLSKIFYYTGPANV